MIYFLQRRHRHYWVDQDLILPLKALSDVKFLNSMGIRPYICTPNEDKVSDPYITVLRFLHWNADLCLILKDLVFNLKTSVIISAARLMFYFKHFNCQRLQIFLIHSYWVVFFGKKRSEIIVDKTQCPFHTSWQYQNCDIK